VKVAVLFLWGALSDERTVLQFEVQSFSGPSLAEHVMLFVCLELVAYQQVCRYVCNNILLE
jgi:hypothetical protein